MRKQCEREENGRQCLLSRNHGSSLRHLFTMAEAVEVAAAMLEGSRNIAVDGVHPSLAAQRLREAAARSA